jgi:hypothetical protein
MRRILLFALALAACQKGETRPRGPGKAVLAVTCSADRPVVRVGDTATIQCTPSSGARAVSWSVEPGRGALAPAGASATFVLRAAQVDPGFGDTTFTVTATFAGDEGSGAGSAALIVLGNTWLARADSPQMEAFASDGTSLGPVSVGLDGPAVALAHRADGALLAAQVPSGGAPPVVVLSRAGARSGAFDAKDGSGAPLFTVEHPPRALRQMRDGNVWVTGGSQPAIYDAGGRFLRRAAEAPAETVGLAQLSDGRVAVTYQWAFALGIYDEGGASLAKSAIASALPGNEGYGEAGALSLDARGRLVAAAAHLTSSGWTGTLLRLSLDPAVAVEAELPTAARVAGNVPWELSVFGEEIDSAPSPTVATTRSACPQRFAADLSRALGCLSTGTSYRGVVHLGAPR